MLINNYFFQQSFSNLLSSSFELHQYTHYSAMQNIYYDMEIRILLLSTLNLTLDYSFLVSYLLFFNTPVCSIS